MTEPLIEQIAAVLLARLKTVRTDSGSNYTASKVVRPGRRGNYSPEHLLIVQLQDDPRRDEENSVEGNPYRCAWIQPFLLALFVKPSDDDHEPIDAIINRFSADVVKAVGQPEATWHNFDGLAHNAFWADPVGFEVPNGALEGVLLTLDVLYRTPESNPYTQG